MSDVFIYASESFHRFTLYITCSTSTSVVFLRLYMFSLCNELRDILVAVTIVGHGHVTIPPRYRYVTLQRSIGIEESRNDAAVVSLCDSNTLLRQEGSRNTILQLLSQDSVDAFFLFPFSDVFILICSNTISCMFIANKYLNQCILLMKNIRRQILPFFFFP
jgi:hypothetical protein